MEETQPCTASGQKVTDGKFSVEEKSQICAGSNKISSFLENSRDFRIQLKSDKGSNVRSLKTSMKPKKPLSFSSQNSRKKHNSKNLISYYFKLDRNFGVNLLKQTKSDKSDLTDSGFISHQ